MTDFEMDKIYTITGREFLALLSLIPDGTEKAKVIMENVAGRENSQKINESHGEAMVQGSRRMRYTWIDGIYVEVDRCDSCPFYDGGDDGYADHCQYPNNKASFCSEYRYSEPDVAEDCPLRVKE